jgi:DNA-binding transcriptional regulator YdaS (Cro superfamily)
MQKSCFELRAALESMAFRHSWLAELCGVKPVQVWRWCEGVTPIPAYVWTILALIKGVKVHDVRRGELPSWEVKKHHVYRNMKDFKLLAKRFHPDVSGRDTKAEMQIINKYRKS